MIFTKEQVFDKCDEIVLKYDLDPDLIKAICMQESARSKIGNFAPDIARLEFGYYRKYTEPQNLATTSEILLAASYGIMQLMGESLKELGYFEDYFNRQNSDMRELLGHPLSQFNIPSALDHYCVSLTEMIDSGCRWFLRKLEIAKGDTNRALLLWNGGGNPDYPNEVIKKMKLIKQR